MIDLARDRPVERGSASRLVASPLQRWWQVDLGQPCLIRAVVLCHARRLWNVTVFGSPDGVTWQTLFRREDDAPFAPTVPSDFTAPIAGDRLARFLRVRPDGDGALPFATCQVLGERPDAALLAALLARDAAAAAARRAVPEDRPGHLVEIDGFAVFVDRTRYGPAVTAALERGTYEQRERTLARKLLRPADRVLEAGTAVGVVAMTAAAIVGAANVLTFDANPDILADARDNFRRNGLADIRARAGALRNRAAGGAPGDTIEFCVSREFWASRLAAGAADPEVIRRLPVPLFCLEDEIVAHRANVLICDIEGGEVALLMQADLAPIRMILLETHYWAAGEAATDALLRRLLGDGFALHLGHSGHHVLVLRR